MPAARRAATSWSARMLIQPVYARNLEHARRYRERRVQRPAQLALLKNRIAPLRPNLHPSAPCLIVTGSKSSTMRDVLAVLIAEQLTTTLPDPSCPFHLMEVGQGRSVSGPCSLSLPWRFGAHSPSRTHSIDVKGLAAANPVLPISLWCCRPKRRLNTALKPRFLQMRQGQGPPASSSSRPFSISLGRRRRVVGQIFCKHYGCH